MTTYSGAQIIQDKPRADLEAAMEIKIEPYKHGYWIAVAVAALATLASIAVLRYGGARDKALSTDSGPGLHGSDR